MQEKEKRAQIQRLSCLPGSEKISLQMIKEYERVLFVYRLDVLVKAVDKAIENEFRYPTIHILKDYCERIVCEEREREAQRRRLEEGKHKEWYDYLKQKDSLAQDCIQLIKEKCRGAIDIYEYIERMKGLERKYPNIGFLVGAEKLSVTAKKGVNFRDKGQPYREHRVNLKNDTEGRKMVIF